MMARDAGSKSGRLGLAASSLIWLLSLPVLGLMMRLNESASAQGIGRDLRGSTTSLHVAVVLYGLLFTGLQLTAPLLMAWTLRVSYGFRAAACFAVSAVSVMILDCVGLLGMLIWLRVTLGSG